MKRYEIMTKEELYLSFLNSDFCKKEWCNGRDCTDCINAYYNEEVIEE